MAELDGWVIVEIVYLCLLFVCGTIGNLLVILAVMTTPSLRQRSNFFIVILAICDLVTSTICVPFYALTLGYGEWPFGDFWCVFLAYVTLWSLGWSVTTLALIAGNRYLSITRPRYNYNRLCNNFSILVSTLGQILLGLVFIMLPPFVEVGTVGFNPILGHCTYVYYNFKDWIYVLVLFLSGVVSTTLVLPSYYAMTFYIVRRSRLNIASVQQRSLSSSNLDKRPVARSTTRFAISRDEVRLTRKLVLLFVLFLFCWLPYSMVVFLDSDMSVSIPAQRVTNLLLWSNSGINPFLYAWMMRRFRLAYKRLITFKCLKRCRQIAGSEGSIINHSDHYRTTPETVNQRSIWLWFNGMQLIGSSQFVSSGILQY